MNCGDKLIALFWAETLATKVTVTAATQRILTQSWMATHASNERQKLAALDEVAHCRLWFLARAASSRVHLRKVVRGNY